MKSAVKASASWMSTECRPLESWLGSLRQPTHSVLLLKLEIWMGLDPMIAFTVTLV
jgi:hypothetical protein